MGVTENLLKKIKDGNGDQVDKEMLNARIKVAHTALHELMSSTHVKLGELIAKYGLELKLLDTSLIFASRNALDEDDYTAEQPLSLFSCFGSKEGIDKIIKVVEDATHV